MFSFININRLSSFLKITDPLRYSKHSLDPLNQFYISDYNLLTHFFPIPKRLVSIPLEFELDSVLLNYLVTWFGVYVYRILLILMGEDL